MANYCRLGGIGRRTGLKILRWKHRTGSIPVAGILSTLYFNLESEIDIMTSSTYVFENKSDMINLAVFLTSAYDDIANTKAKVSTAMYFAWIQYALTFGQLDSYPDQLFKADFKAVQYGVADKMVGFSFTDLIFETSHLRPHMSNSLSVDQKQMINESIKRIIQKVSEFSDFEMTIRIHQDAVWHNSFTNESDQSILSNDILSEYSNRMRL